MAGSPSPLRGIRLPFEPFLRSADPVALYRLAFVPANAQGLDPRQYDMPHLPAATRSQIARFVRARQVLDPLAMVLWGNATVDAVDKLLEKLDGWDRARLSMPQDGFVRMPSGNSFEPQTNWSLQSAYWVPRRAPGFVRIPAGLLARHHIRLMEPFNAGGQLGTVTLVGAHTERIWPRFWHEVTSWHRGRNRFALALRTALPASSFDRLDMSAGGRYQRRPFDGQVYFVRVP